jgi:hypothetical protein
MRILVVFCIITSSVYGQGVINAITAPVNASGLAWDGNYLWCGAYGVNGDTIYKLDPINGTILKRLRWRQNADSYGLTFDQEDLWVNDHLTGTDSIFRIDTITGARVNAIPAHKEYMAGLANDGTHLWHCVYYSPDGRAYQIQKTNGAALDSIDIFSLPQPWGAAWDGQYLWVCNDGDYGGAHRIYKIDVVLKQIVDSLDSPGIRPWGLTWDGSYLWVIAHGTSPTGFVAYQIDLQGGGTPDIQVTPSSYNYGYVPFDTTFSFTLNIANVGTDTLTIDTICTLNPVFSTTPLTFPIEIADGANMNVSVYCSPDTFTYYAANLLIVSDDPVNETTFVPLTARGVYPDPHLSPNVTSHDFGTVRVNCVNDWNIAITNEGYPTLVINSIVYNDTRFFTGNQSFPIAIPCLDTVMIQMITRPNAGGSYSGTAEIYSNDPVNPNTIQLSASGDTSLPQAGALLWSCDFPDNVVCVAGIADINGDNINDVAAESYEGNVEKHLNAYWGNSSGHGVLCWDFGDEATTGSYGDDCLVRGNDYNADGVDDVILGTAWGDRSVYALDGVTGTVIWYYDSHWFDGEGGWVYSVRPMPDINGDNVGEVLAGIGGHDSGTAGPRSIYCFSGVDGQIIWRLQALDAIGSVNWIPDVNDDGVPDAIGSAWGNGLDEKVYCVSGASTGVVYTPLWSYNCGADIQSVIPIPDVNGDGKADVVAGAWNDSVFCLSGANGVRIWATYVGGFVIKVAAIPDLIAPGTPGIGVAHWGSLFHVLNAATGAIYWYYPIGGNVWTVDAIEDLNNDGKHDVVTGNQSPGIVYCLSGEDGSVIWTYNEGRLIFSVRAVDDISFDGYQDVIVGTQDAGGVAHVLALCGGTPGTGIDEGPKQQFAGIDIYPRIGRNLFTISFARQPVHEVNIYDIAGRLVKTYDIGFENSGQVIWNAKDDNGRYVAQGIYFVQINGDDFHQTGKLVIVR